MFEEVLTGRIEMLIYSVRIRWAVVLCYIVYGRMYYRYIPVLDLDVQVTRR